MDDLPNEIRVRPATERDVELLIRVRTSQKHLLKERWRGQREGRGELLIAWIEGRPVGTVYIRWERPDEPYLRRRLTDTPLLNHVEVDPGQRRRGVATRLLEEAEARVRRRGKTAVALGVDLRTFRAMELYTKRDYQAWQRLSIDTTKYVFREDGTRFEVEDRCWIFIKELTGAGNNRCTDNALNG